jgi:hypothetical protein
MIGCGLMAPAQDETVHARERLQRAVRQCGAVRIERAAADRHRPPIDEQAMALGRCGCDRHCSGNDFMTDVVAVQDAQHEMSVIHA